MSLTFTTANDVLKEDYQEPLREQLNNFFFITSQVEKNTTDFEGKRAYHALHVSRSSGVGARAEGGTLPTAGNQGYTDAVIPVRFNYGKIKLTRPVIKAMASSRGSFIRALRSEMDGLRNDVKRDVNRQLWGTSDGVIAATDTTSSSTTINIAGMTAVQARQLYADGGMVIDIGTVANPTSKASARTVTAVDAAAGTITISGAAVATTPGERIFRTGSGGATSGSGLVGDGQNELTGLQTIVSDTGSLHTVDPSTYPVWKSGVFDNSGTLRNISEPLVNEAIMDTEIDSGKQVDALVGGPGVMRSMARLMEAMRRNMDTVELKAGFSGIQWSTPMEGQQGVGKRAVVWDRDCPANRLYGLCFEDLVEYVLDDWSWVDDDGAVLSRTGTTDEFEALFAKYHELAAFRRNSHFVIEDLNED